MRTQPIEKIRKRFKKEWLLIAVDRKEALAGRPSRGRLLAHSARRDDV